MNKEYELNSYAKTDEIRGDYMVYEIKYANGWKEYVSREVFRKLKALEIIKEKEVDIGYFKYLCKCFENINTKKFFQNPFEEYNTWVERRLTQEEYDLLKEVI